MNIGEKIGFGYSKSKDKRLKSQLGLKDFKYDLVREDGRLECMCEHGIGHTVGHQDRTKVGEKYWDMHGCDGCCGAYVRMPDFEKE